MMTKEMMNRESIPDNVRSAHPDEAINREPMPEAAPSAHPGGAINREPMPDNVHSSHPDEAINREHVPESAPSAHPDEEMIRERVRKWRRRLDEAGEGVEICAATKMQSAETINLLCGLGVTRIGENRVQELTEKAGRLNPAYRVDMIGHLQTNKVKYIVECVDRVQSVDSPELARALSARFDAAGRNLGVLIQVNIAQEMQKYGVGEHAIMPLAREIASLPALRLEGLMAIMPIAPDPEELRPLFRRMRLWYDRLRQESFGEHADTLSMGMSGDCLIAAQEGATMVRLGTALFGARPRPAQK